MSQRNQRQLGAGAGIAFAILYFLSGAITGSQPKFTASAAKIVSYYNSHHTAFLVSAVLAGVSAALFVAWGAALAAVLRAGGSPTAAGTVLASAAAGISLATMQPVLNAGLDQVARGGYDPNFVRGGYQVQSYVGHLAFWFAAVAAVATVLAGARLFAAWYRWLSLIAAALFALGGVSLKATGFFGASSAGGFLGFVALLVWAIATSVLLWRLEPSGADATAAAPAPV